MKFFYNAILKTLVYSDIFNYPLKPKELHRFLIFDKQLSFSLFERLLSQVQANEKRIESNENYYFLKGRGKIVDLRKKKEKLSQKKLKTARLIGRLLKLIPTIKLAGITGSLAMNNSEEDDDIDFLIIASKNRLWLTRLLVLLLLEATGKRRKTGDTNVKDKICPNIFLDEKNLALPKKERNLFTAHEICQMKVLWDRDNTYKRFIWENRWVKKFLPNAVKINSKFQIQNSKFHFKIKNFFLDILEKFAFKAQLFYMKPKMTIEKVSQDIAFFHPRDLSELVLKKYNNKIKMLKLKC